MLIPTFSFRDFRRCYQTIHRLKTSDHELLTINFWCNTNQASTLSGYTCTCSHGYTGTTCNTGMHATYSVLYTMIGYASEWVLLFRFYCVSFGSIWLKYVDSHFLISWFSSLLSNNTSIKNFRSWTINY
jgi:hypothetical protein